MIVRVLDASMIADFVGEGFNSTEICSIVKSETERKASLIQSEKLRDWEICFRFWYNNVKQILIYTKNKSYSKERYKEITIHLPIPTDDKVEWGVDISQHVYKNENHLDHLMKNFYCLDVDYSRFNDRQDYILDCMRRSITFCFKEGFTINGVKVKIDTFSLGDES